MYVAVQAGEPGDLLHDLGGLRVQLLLVLAQRVERRFDVTAGIGLVLSRQIAEAHGGSLTLENRTDSPGCRAFLRLPV